MDGGEEKKEEYPDVPPPPYPGPPAGAQQYYPPPEYSAQPYTPAQGVPTYPPQQGVPYPQGGPRGPYPAAQGYPQALPAYPIQGYQSTQPGGYQGYPPGQGTAICSQPVSGTITCQTTSSEPKPQSYLTLAVITCLCFSPIFGLIAICFSGMYISNSILILDEFFILL